MYHYYFDDINIFVLDTGISDTNKEHIGNICREYSANIFFIDVENIEDNLDISLNKMRVKGTFSLATYSRLFLASLLPQNIDKVLYLDCDGLVLDSFKPLWDLNLDDYYGAGVLALNGNDNVKNDIDMVSSDRYINAGMLLANLKKWREDDIETKFIDELIRLNNKGIPFGMDQGVINSVLHEKLYIVPPEFNLEGSLHNTNYDITMKLHTVVQNGFYDKSILDNAIKNPVFQHFCVGDGEFYNRPWLNPHHENKKIYEDYFKLSGFKREEVYFYKKVPFIKRFNRFLPRNRITSFLIVKLIPKNVCEKIVGSNTLNNEKKDIDRW